jgi:hypothetical protein
MGCVRSLLESDGVQSHHFYVVPNLPTPKWVRTWVRVRLLEALLVIISFVIPQMMVIELRRAADCILQHDVPALQHRSF